MATANLKSKISLDSSEFVTAANGVLAQTRKMAIAAGGLVTAFAGLKAVQGTLKGITSATGAAANLEALNVELRTFLGGADEARVQKVNLHNHLKKINDQGMPSLTKAERRFLQDRSKRLRDDSRG